MTRNENGSGPVHIQAGYHARKRLCRSKPNTIEVLYSTPQHANERHVLAITFVGYAGVLASSLIDQISGHSKNGGTCGGRSCSEIATTRPTSSSLRPRASGCALSARRRA